MKGLHNLQDVFKHASKTVAMLNDDLDLLLSVENDKKMEEFLNEILNNANDVLELDLTKIKLDLE